MILLTLRHSTSFRSLLTPLYDKLWACHFTALSLSFLIGPRKIIIVADSRGWEDSMRTGCSQPGG